MSRTSTLTRLRSRFDTLSGLLQQSENFDRCSRPLGDWTAVTDRAIPFALLNKSVSQVVGEGFKAAAEADGIGLKKLAGLIVLLERAASARSVAPTVEANPNLPSRSVFTADATRLRYASRSCLAVRQVDWDAWRIEIGRSAFATYPIGRYLTRLRDLPQSAWETPVAFYAQCSFCQLYALPLHGSRRVAAVASVFQQLAADPDTQSVADHGRPKAVVQFLRKLESWRDGALPKRKSSAEFVRPALDLIEADLGRQVSDIVAQLLDVTPDGVRVAGWNRYYRQLVRMQLAVRCPEAVTMMADLEQKAPQFSPPQQQAIARWNALFGA